MSAATLVVLASPDDPALERLQQAPRDLRVVVGDRLGTLRDAAEAADVIFYCSGGRELLEAVFARAPRVRWIHARTAGVDSILFPALVESPVPLTNARGVYSRALAEFVMAGLLFFAKDVRRMLRQQAAGEWMPFEPGSLYGRNLGIVGFGDIGRKSARMARALGMRVLALRRHPEAGDPDADAVFGPERLLEMLSLSDDVLLATPLTPETRGLIGPRQIAAIRPGGVFVNVGRGPVVDEAALVAALQAGKLRGAALDVFEQEPLRAGHPFYCMDSVLLSPHCADRIAGWLLQATDCFLDNLNRFLQGLPLSNLVDKRRGY